MCHWRLPAGQHWLGVTPGDNSPEGQQVWHAQSLRRWAWPRRFIGPCTTPLSTTGPLATTAQADDYLRPRVVPHVVPHETPRLGFTGRMQFGCGLQVDHVQYGSLAERIGLEPGDVLLSVNGRRITSHGEYQQLLREAAQYRDGHIQVMIDNVRARRGESGASRYVTRTARLDSGASAPMAGYAGRP